MKIARPLVLFALAAAAVALGACATTGTRHPAAGQSRRSITAVEEPGVPIPGAEDQAKFRAKLQAELDRDFARGKDYTLYWKVTEADRGSRALRYLVGFGAGKAKVLVQVRVVDRAGREVARQIAEGDQVMGVYGGSFESAVFEAAEAAAEVARVAVYGKS